jgi:hypothetical protein
MVDFFYVPNAATHAELAQLADGITSGRIRPQIVLRGGEERQFPPAIWDYIDRRYRAIDQVVFERLPD